MFEGEILFDNGNKFIGKVHIRTLTKEAIYFIEG
jgi:hypothetical protein